jgi:hypothetical protein
MKEVQESVKDMFKQSHQHHCLDDNSNIDKTHQVELIKDITMSECFNLADLHQPITKKTKTQHFAPITIALLEMQLGKSTLHKFRVLFDSGSSGSIIVAKFIKKLHIQNDTKTEWLTKGETLDTSGKCKTNFILHKFYKVNSLNGSYMSIRFSVLFDMT